MADVTAAAAAAAWWPDGERPYFLLANTTADDDGVLVPVRAVHADEHRHGTLPIAFELACLDFVRSSAAGAALLDKLKAAGFGLELHPGKPVWRRPDTTHQDHGDRRPWIDCDATAPDAVQFVRLGVRELWTAGLTPAARNAYNTLHDNATELQYASGYVRARGHASLADRLHHQADAALSAAEELFRHHLRTISSRPSNGAETQPST